MAKPGPKPQRPRQALWTQRRPLAVAAASLLGLLALGIGMQQFFSSNGSDRLPQQVGEYLDREKQESPAERHADLEQRLRHLAGLLNDPGFGKLPRAQQDAVRYRHRELRDYQEYAKALANIEDPGNARSLEQLRKIQASLLSLRVLPEYVTEWEGTAARERHKEWLADAGALERAVQEVLQRYHSLSRDGQEVLARASAANLPLRAKEVLDRERKLPDPVAKKADLLPDSRRLTYAAVLAFPAVTEAQAQWGRVRKTLEGLAGLRKP